MNDIEKIARIRSKLELERENFGITSQNLQSQLDVGRFVLTLNQIDTIAISGSSAGPTIAGISNPDRRRAAGGARLGNRPPQCAGKLGIHRIVNK